jgi:PAP2 superfamily
VINTGFGGPLPYVVAGVLLLAIRAAVPRSPRRSLRLLRELLLLIPFVLWYFAARGLAAERPALATAHAAIVIGWERTLGIFHEVQLQRAWLAWPPGIDLVNWMYIWGHWPIIIATFVWLGVQHPDALPRYRNAMIMSGLVGFAIFFVYPVAPPRYLPQYGFIDTITLRSRAYRVLQPPSLEDLYASMPSLHVGWNLLMGIALVRESKHRATRALGIALPIVMFAAVVLTANHYFLDGLAGAAIVLASYWWAATRERRERMASNRVPPVSASPAAP